MCFGTGVTRFCCPCSKSNLQNCYYVVGSFSAAYATLLYWLIYNLTTEEVGIQYRSLQSLQAGNNSVQDLSGLLIAVSIISLVVSSLLLYGVKRKSGLILQLWPLTALLNVVWWTIGFLVFLPIPIGYSVLSLPFIWAYFIYATLIVGSGIEEIEKEKEEKNRLKM